MNRLNHKTMKNEIRNQNKIKRLEMTTQEVHKKSRAAAKEFLQSTIYKNALTIMLYMPIQNETDTEKIIKTALKDGKKIVFPVTKKEIIPYYASIDTEFKKGKFGVNEPNCTLVASPSEIDVIIVPGIAFDKTGARVGFGKGYYDMFLPKTNAVKVGLCYEFQLYDKIQTAEHDVKMNFIVTENGLIKCKI